MGRPVDAWLCQPTGNAAREQRSEECSSNTAATPLTEDLQAMHGEVARAGMEVTSLNDEGDSHDYRTRKSH